VRILREDLQAEVAGHALLFCTMSRTGLFGLHTGTGLRRLWHGLQAGTFQFPVLFPHLYREGGKAGTELQGLRQSLHADRAEGDAVLQRGMQIPVHLCEPADAGETMQDLRNAIRDAITDRKLLLERLPQQGQEHHKGFPACG
jgi:hypothetical protein